MSNNYEEFQMLTMRENFSDKNLKTNNLSKFKGNTNNIKDCSLVQVVNNYNNLLEENNVNPHINLKDKIVQIVSHSDKVNTNELEELQIPQETKITHENIEENPVDGNIKDKDIKNINSNDLVNDSKTIARKRWDKLRIYTKGLTSFNKLNKNIQLFGTSEEVFDEKNAEKYLTKLKNIQGEKNNPDQIKIDNNSIFNNICEKLSAIPVFHPEDTIIYIWNIIIGIFMFYTAIIMPYNVCFFDQEIYFFNIFDTVVDFTFMIDLIITCNLSFYDAENEEITNRKKIFINYLKSWFFIDLISSLPLSLIENKMVSNSNMLRLTRISKMYRLFRILRIFKVSKVFKDASSLQKIQEFFKINFGLSRLISFLFTTLLLSHIVGCLWYSLSKLSDENNNWIVNTNLQDEPAYRLYLFSIYWTFSTLFTVGFGDIHAYNRTEYVLSIFWMLFGVGFYSFTIGTLSSILVNMDTRENILKYKLSILNDFSKETKLSVPLKEKIKKILIYNSQKNIFSWMDKQEIFNELPANLKCEIASSMRQGFLKDINFFHDKDDAFVAMIVPFLQPLNFQEREPIYKKHDHPNAIYFITCGRVFFVNDEYIPFKIMIKGSYFGEIEIVGDTKTVRGFSVIASEKTDTLSLSKQNYENIVLREFPEIGNEIKLLAEKRKVKFLESEENLKNLMMSKKMKTLKHDKVDDIIKLADNKHINPTHNPIVESFPNQNNDLNNLLSEENLIDKMRFKFDKRNSLLANQMKIETAEQQLKFFTKTPILKQEEINQNDTLQTNKNIIIIDTESNNEKENPVEEPFKLFKNFSHEAKINNKFDIFNNKTDFSNKDFNDSGKKKNFDILNNISEDSENESQSYDSSSSGSDDKKEEDLNIQENKESIDKKISEYSKAQKKMISKIGKLMNQFKLVNDI